MLSMWLWGGSDQPHMASQPQPDLPREHRHSTARHLSCPLLSLLLLLLGRVLTVSG